MLSWMCFCSEQTHLILKFNWSGRFDGMVFVRHQWKKEHDSSIRLFCLLRSRRSCKYLCFHKQIGTFAKRLTMRSRFLEYCDGRRKQPSLIPATRVDGSWIPGHKFSAGHELTTNDHSTAPRKHWAQSRRAVLYHNWQTSSNELQRKQLSERQLFPHLFFANSTFSVFRYQIWNHSRSNNFDCCNFDQALQWREA